MTTFNIAGVQMPISIHGDNSPAMLQKAAEALHVHPWIEMLVFSELAPNGPSIHLASSDITHIESLFREFAEQHKVWICPGSLFVNRHGSIYNHAFVVAPSGEIVGRYDKQYSFLLYERHVAAGTDFLFFDVPDVGRFGLSICYDVWFPETTRTLVSNGVEVLIHPVMTGTTDRDVELSIAQATAAMFQCYVFDVNGLEAGGVGKSLVADPSGRIVYQAGQLPESFPIEIDLDLVRRARQSGANGLGQTLKSFRDSRLKFDIYKRGASSPYLTSLGPLEMPSSRYK